MTQAQKPTLPEPTDPLFDPRPLILPRFGEDGREWWWTGDKATQWRDEA